ncbi:MAG: O-antigen translocase, partial [Duncaniella sp.]|nr:O-antigen translocase [Duncaniella sp.]
MVSTQENSYRNIIKRLSAFGGVQVFNILISLLRGKFVALFLGPDGMGISSLFASSTATIQQLSGLGLSQSRVKEVAAAKDSPDRLNRLVKICLRLLLGVSALGALICALLAPLWSRLAFGNDSQSPNFILLSIFIALSTAGGGYLALLQGLGEIKRLSKSSLVGGTAGLLFGVPLYYFYGIDGIVPAMLILSLCTFAFYYISYRRAWASRPSAALPTEPIDSVGTEKTGKIVQRLISLGLVLLIGSLAGTLTNYLIVLYVRIYGSVESVGLFQAANSITNQYIGLVFSALALDYFPRLSAVSSDPQQMREVVNRQTEVVMLVAAPIIALLILTAPIVIQVLLSSEFLCIIPLMRWLGFGMLMNAINFPLGYVFIARGERRIFLWLECLWGNLCWIACSIAGYYLFGLIGLGISLVARGVIDSAVYILICRRRYGFAYSRSAAREIALALLLCGLCFAASLAETSWSYP